MDNDEEKECKKPIIIRNSIDLQRLKLEKLMTNIDKPVIIPERPKEKGVPSVPDFVRNVMGSSAGAGSGEFHVYRHLRRKEYARQKYMKEKAEREKLEEDYHKRLEENRKKAEERTAKKRLKRLKKKSQKRSMKRIKLSQENIKNESSTTEESEDECSESNTEELQKTQTNENDNTIDNGIPTESQKSLDDNLEEQKLAFPETVNSNCNNAEDDNKCNSLFAEENK